MDVGVLVINARTCQSEGVFSPDDFKQFLLSRGSEDAGGVQYTCFL